MVPSLWAQYSKELMGRMMIEDENSFVSYSFPEWAPDCIMVHDMFVVPDQRRTGLGTKVFQQIEEIGRQAGKKAVIAHIELSTKCYDKSWAAQLAVGLLPISAENGKILLRKVL